MKTLNFLLIMCAVLITFSSCQKEEGVSPKTNTDSIVGEWSVSNGDAIAYISGIKFELEIGTAGTLTFHEGGKGRANFELTFDGETDAVEGPFTWERDGFEIIVNSGGEIRRWVLVDDKTNLKSVQFTEEVEDGEVEFTLQLDRM